mmetsp:Transcript_118635/g.369595  ORF Transcript_118635/g.369595 Transcript_118635/m.369595 type:complete len:402 (-) Transcript_118635:7-1212(-)
MHLAAGPTQALHPGLHRPHLRDDARIRERAAARTPPRQPGRGRAESGCRCPRCRCLLGDGLRDQRAAGPDARARRRRVPRGAAGRRLRHVCAAQRTRGQRRLRPGLPRPRGAQRRPLPGPGTLHSCGLPHRAALRLHAAFLAGARSGTARREAAGRRAPRHLGECRSQARALVGTFRSLPALLQRVFAVQFLFSMGKNGAMIFATDWFGEVVYGGDPRGPPDSDSLARFHKGVRMGSLAMLGCGAISGLFGLALPLMLRACRKQRLWAAALGFGAATMSAMALLHRPVGLAVALAVALGVALGARESIPWSVVTAVTKGTSSTGACTAMFNLSQAVPTLIPILTGSAVLQVASLSAVLGLCAVPMALASALVLAVVPADLDAAELAAGSAMPGPVSPKEEA